jgi:hypothetical protein
MRRIFAAAAIAAAFGAASAANAATFSGNYSVSGYYNSDNGGLNIDIYNGSGSFNVANLVAGGSTTFNLFEITTPESVNIPDPGYNPNDDDGVSKTLHVDFTFSNPTNFPGSGPDATVNGFTVGLNGTNDDYGNLTWAGPAQVNFGSTGLLTITLSPATFDTYDYGHSVDWNIDHGNKAWVKATFALAAPTGGVPEPASWAMMISGFGMAGATLRRRRTAAAAA